MSLLLAASLTIVMLAESPSQPAFDVVTADSCSQLAATLDLQDPKPDVIEMRELGRFISVRRQLLDRPVRVSISCPTDQEINQLINAAFPNEVDAVAYVHRLRGALEAEIGPACLGADKMFAEAPALSAEILAPVDRHYASWRVGDTTLSIGVFSPPKGETEWKVGLMASPKVVTKVVEEDGTTSFMPEHPCDHAR